MKVLLTSNDCNFVNHILTQNSAAMQYLQRGDTVEALKLLREAKSFFVDEQSRGIEMNTLYGITLNNLGCLYRKEGKPFIALKMVQKALEVETQDGNMCSNVSGTLLNLCAILSSIGRHKEAIQHAEQALSIVKSQKEQIEDINNDQGCSTQTEVVCYYNIGAEWEHLKEQELSIESFQKGLDLAKGKLKVEDPLFKKLAEALCRAKKQNVRNRNKSQSDRLQKDTLSKIPNETTQKKINYQIAKIKVQKKMRSRSDSISSQQNFVKKVSQKSFILPKIQNTSFDTQDSMNCELSKEVKELKKLLTQKETELKIYKKRSELIDEAIQKDKINNDKTTDGQEIKEIVQSDIKKSFNFDETVKEEDQFLKINNRQRLRLPRKIESKIIQKEQEKLTSLIPNLDSLNREGEFDHSQSERVYTIHEMQHLFPSNSEKFNNNNTITYNNNRQNLLQINPNNEEKENFSQDNKQTEAKRKLSNISQYAKTPNSSSQCNQYTKTPISSSPYNQYRIPSSEMNIKMPLIDQSYTCGSQDTVFSTVLKKQNLEMMSFTPNQRERLNSNIQFNSNYINKNLENEQQNQNKQQQQKQQQQQQEQIMKKNSSRFRGQNTSNLIKQDNQKDNDEPKRMNYHQKKDSIKKGKRVYSNETGLREIQRN